MSDIVASVPSFRVLRFDAMDERGMRGPMITLRAVVALVSLMLRNPRAMVLADTAQGLRLARLVSFLLPRRTYIVRFGNVFQAPDHHALRGAVGLKRRLYDGALKMADHIVVPSKAAKAALVDAGVRRSEAISVIANGREFPAKRRPTFSNDSPVRLRFVGRLDARKAPLTAVEALAILRTRHGLDARLDIFGDGPDRALTERRASELDVDKAVSFHGLAPDPWINIGPNVVLLHPALYEGFGYSVVEAIAHGIPCLAFAGVGGPEEIIDATNGGLIVAERSAQALANGLMELLKNPADLRRRAEDAQAAVRARYGVETMIAHYDALLSKLEQRRV